MAGSARVAVPTGSDERTNPSKGGALTLACAPCGADVRSVASHATTDERRPSSTARYVEKRSRSANGLSTFEYGTTSLGRRVRATRPIRTRVATQSTRPARIDHAAHSNGSQHIAASTAAIPSIRSIWPGTRSSSDFSSFPSDNRLRKPCSQRAASSTTTPIAATFAGCWPYPGRIG